MGSTAELQAEASAPDSRGAANGIPEDVPETAGITLAWHDHHLDASAVDAVCAALGERLLDAGVDRRRAVLLVMGDTGASVLAFLAVARLGVRIEITDAGRLRQVDEDARSRMTLVVAERGVEGVGASVDLAGPISEVLAMHRDGTLLAAGAGLDLSEWWTLPEALRLSTSGSRGAPVAVRRPGPELMADSVATARHLGLRASDRLLPLLPLGHQYGLSVVLIAIVARCGLVLANRLRLGEVVRTIERHGVTSVDASPRVYQGLLDHFDRVPEAVPRVGSVRVWGVGGAPLREPLRVAFLDRVGSPLLDGYGSTEHGNIAIIPPGSRDRGMVPLATYEVRVVDVDGVPVGDGDEGMVEVRRLGAAVGSPGWRGTDDMGSLRDGRLLITGRTGALHRNGYTISPSSIEGRLRDRGVPAEVIPVEGSAEGHFWIVIEDRLARRGAWWRDVLGQILPEHEMPNHVEVLRSLPMLGDLKPDRSGLRALVSGLARGRAHPPGAADAPHRLGWLVDVARARRREIIDAVAPFGGPAVAAADYRAFLAALENAEGELALEGPVADPPVFVSLSANALLENLALFALIPSAWSRRVRVRAASGSATAVAGVLELLRPALTEDVEVMDCTQSEFVDAIAAEPAVFVFCGRRENLERIQRRLTRQHLVVFFGRGYNPAIVTADADLPRAAASVVGDRMFNAGQDCLAPNAVFVDARVWDAFLPLLTGHVEDVVSGSSELPGARVGPIGRRDVLDGVLDHLVRHRSRIRFGGSVDIARLTVHPTILEWELGQDPDPREHFAPVFDLVRYTDLEDVMDRIHDDRFLENALGVTTWGVPAEVAERLTATHLVAFDDSLFHVGASYQPFGGTGHEGGYVRYGGRTRTGPILLSRAVRELWQHESVEGSA
ncbi:4-hydroxybenzoate--CoA/benzoate--CoA ligase [Clavibacter michiganensis]|nr:4-hydroxybenzoate--CoA/benzoate--CoA ligase [Clavibacter michiganensis]